MRESLLLIALLAFCAIAEEPVAANTTRVCLLTGFQPFGGAKINPSWETVKTFNGMILAGYRIVAVELPVVYDEIAEPLAKAIKANEPTLVISFGLGGGIVSVETIARNGYHLNNPVDNKGNPPPRENILPDGPAQINTALPADAIVKALKHAGIGAQSSIDAGGYLCNECFYRLMNAGKDKDSGGENIAARGFVHLPNFGDANPAGGEYTPETLKTVVKTVVEVTVRAISR